MTVEAPLTARPPGPDDDGPRLVRATSLPDGTPSVDVAIVGAGPSGFYAVDGLLRARPDLHIDILDRLPTPYGLVRAGVANADSVAALFVSVLVLVAAAHLMRENVSASG